MDNHLNTTEQTALNWITEIHEVSESSIEYAMKYPDSCEDVSFYLEQIDNSETIINVFKELCDYRSSSRDLKTLIEKNKAKKTCSIQEELFHDNHRRFSQCHMPVL